MDLGLQLDLDVEIEVEPQSQLFVIASLLFFVTALLFVARHETTQCFARLAHSIGGFPHGTACRVLDKILGAIGNTTDLVRDTICDVANLIRDTANCVRSAPNRVGGLVCDTTNSLTNLIDGTKWAAAAATSTTAILLRLGLCLRLLPLASVAIAVSSATGLRDITPSAALSITRRLASAAATALPSGL